MHWAPLVKIAGVGIALFLLNYLNDLATFERGYDTQLTQSIFTIMQLFGAIAGGLLRNRETRVERRTPLEPRLQLSRLTRQLPLALRRAT